MAKESYTKTHTKLAKPAELSILFILSQGERKTAYFIKQYINKIGLHEWMPTSMVTVYNALKRLAKANFVKEKNTKKGKKDITCYYITESGKKYLDKNLKSELANPFQNYFRFDLTIGLSSYIPNETKIDFIEQRILKLRKSLKDVRKKLRNYKMNTPFGAWIILDHQIYYLKHEIAWSKRLIKLLKQQESVV
ncbi:MAG: PadR family transcriptional regulator [Verrucomicrobiota bacterium]|nr:PadR family transcriptional regulator [Verrucomicrobiota bacterium]